MRPRLSTAKRRAWSLLPLAVWLVVGTLASNSSAQLATQSVEDLPPNEIGEGWFWNSRPTYVAPVTGSPADPVIGNDPGAQAVRAFSDAHYYVGWDGSKKVPEMVSGINYDLSEQGIDPEATITNFTIKIFEHPVNSGTPAGSGSQGHPAPNAAEAAPDRHGIVACPWSEYIAGSKGAPMTEAPGGRDCSQKATGQRGPNVGTASDSKYEWTFDVTSIMASLHSSGSPLSISLEPTPDPTKAASWVTSLHMGVVLEGGKPSVRASISWIPGEGSAAAGFDFGGLTTDSFLGSSGTSDPPSFGDTTGLGGELAGDQQVPEEPVRAAAVLGEGSSADFWDIPLYAWVGLLAAVAFFLFSGWNLQLEPGASSRPPGAVSKLMAGHSGEEGLRSVE
jgi:hypothetical protein